MVTVRRIEEGDVPHVAAIYAHEAVIANTGQVPFRTDAFWRDFYKTRDPDGLELVGVVDGKAVGHLGLLTNRAPRRKHVANFGIAVHPDYQGQGVGKALMAEMLHQADNWLNLVRVELSVVAENVRAIALYEKFGFVHEGQSRFDIFSGGRYCHLNHMARIRPGWAGE